MFTSEQLTKIFTRIGLTYTPSLPCDFETLAAVQLGFQYNVPYENLDILLDLIILKFFFADTGITFVLPQVHL